MVSNYLRAVLLGIILFFCISNTSIGQPKEWEDISREELEMTVYPSDSSASAVVLFDKGIVELNYKLEYVMNRHIRIKIFNEEGYKWAKAEMSYNEELDQDIRKVRGYTYTLNDNGKIEKHKLRRRSIYEEDVDDDYKRVKFTMPALQPGAVIEYKYRKDIVSPHLLPDWQFQRSIPVAWSEYNVQIPDWFFYNKMFVGSHSLYKNETERFREQIRLNYKRRSGGYVARTDYGSTSIDMDGEYKKWVMKDLPAVEELPYMTSVDDYKAKLWIQLTEVRFPRQRIRHFLKTWSDVAKEIRKIDSFGGQLKSKSEFQTIAKGLTDGISDPKQKMQKIFEYMIESMIWDGSYYFLAENDIDDVLQEKKGNSAELNLLLVQILREAGLDANPVLLSTREHGKVLDYFAFVNQFNHVIANVTIGGELYLLDATSDDSSVDILPVQDLNNKGLVIGTESQNWVGLKPRVKTKSKISINGKITPDGKVNGKLFVSSQGYHASEEGLKIEEKARKKLAQNVLKENFQTGDSFELPSEKLKGSDLAYELSLNEYEMESQKSDDRFYFNPMLVFRETNPFSQPERDVPVDFPYTFQKEYVANLQIPKGYTVEETPKPIAFTIPGKGAELRRLVQVSQNRVMVLSKLMINKTTFEPEDYKILRNFYSQVVDTQNEQIVLRKIDSDSGTDTGK